MKSFRVLFCFGVFAFVGLSGCGRDLELSGFLESPEGLDFVNPTDGSVAHVADGENMVLEIKSGMLMFKVFQLSRPIYAVQISSENMDKIHLTPTGFTGLLDTRDYTHSIFIDGASVQQKYDVSGKRYEKVLSREDPVQHTESCTYTCTEEQTVTDASGVITREQVTRDCSGDREVTVTTLHKESHWEVEFFAINDSTGIPAGRFETGSHIFTETIEDEGYCD